MTTELQPRPVRRKKPDANRVAPPRNQAKTPSPAPALPGRRNPKWIALGVVALCLGGLLSYVIYAQLAIETSVVSLARTVNRGETIRAEDLTRVTLSRAGNVRAVDAGDLDQVVGQHALFDLVEGSLLPVGAVGPTVVPAAGYSVVGIKLATGRAPSSPLRPGSPVRLIAIPVADTSPADTDDFTGQTFEAQIVSYAPGADGASVVVDVEVSEATAASVAILAAQERLVVVRETEG